MTSKKIMVLSNILSFVFGVGVYACVDKVVDNYKAFVPEKNVAMQFKDNGGMLVTLDENASNGMSMFTERISEDNGVETYEEASYILIATPYPADSSEIEFTWAGKFKDQTNSWAQGKNFADYVSLSSNGLRATLTCKQAFSAQIEITCTYNYNTDISASCTLDYVKRITDVTIEGYNADCFNDGDCQIWLTPVYSEGTLTGEFKGEYAWGELSDKAYSYLVYENTKAAQYFVQWSDLCDGDWNLQQSTKNGRFGANSLENQYIDNAGRYSYDDTTFNYVSDFLNNSPGTSEPSGARKYLEAAFILMSRNTTNQLRCAVSYTYKYGDILNVTDTAYSEYYSISESYLDNSLLSINGVNLNESNIIM